MENHGEVETGGLWVGRGRSGKVSSLSKATSGQKSTMERLSSKLVAGEFSKAGKYGGGQNVIVTSPIKFQMNEDGTVNYTVKGEQLWKPLHSDVIGVGDTPGRMRPVTVTGRIEKTGKIFLSTDAVKKGEEVIVAGTMKQYKKWFAERYKKEVKA